MENALHGAATRKAKNESSNQKSILSGQSGSGWHVCRMYVACYRKSLLRTDLKGNTMFKPTNICKFAEKDNYQTGCYGKAVFSTVDYQIQGKTLSDVKQAIVDFLVCTMADIQINPCGDDASRIDACIYENADGYKATQAEIEQWKNGEIELWLCDYSFTFEYCVPANFEE